MTCLYGPTEEEMSQFRVQVGRQAERWYVDPLPACSLGEPFTNAVPSVSTIKSAWPKHLTKWVANETAKAAVNELAEWKDMPAEAAMAHISGASDTTRDAAANRGTKVHELFEQRARGQQIMLAASLEVGAYVPSVDAVLADLQPEWIASECIAFHVNDSQYAFGGTLDAIWCVNGVNFLVDFKTRKVGKHGAYDEEAAQISAYANADYLIARVDGVLCRVPVPRIDGGLIISITPE